MGILANGFGDLTIGGIGVAVLIFGLVEAAKELGLTGKGSRVLALLLGVLFSALAFGLTQNLIPPEAHPYIIWGVVAIAGGPAAMGYYDLLTGKNRQ